MKKTILLAALLASTATFATAQDGGPGPRGPRPEFKIDLSKIPEQVPQEFKDKAKAADKDGNGVLEGDELKEFAPPRRERPGFGGPGFGPQGPGFGGPGFGPKGPAFGEAFKDGKLDLSKIPEQAPQEFKDKAKAADKDGNGVLEGDELKELAPKFEKPAFVADGKKIDVAKLTEAIKAADKNGDGFIDQDEQKAAFEAARKTFGPAFFGRFAPNPAPFAPRWGAPQPWGPGPQGDWNRGPRGDRNKGPQGDRGRRCRDDRPQGERPNPDAPKAE